MAQARTALDHLLDARAALVDEAQRLATTIADLDSLIGTVGGQDRLAEADDAPVPAAEPVKTAATVAPARTATRATTRRSVSRRGPAKKAADRPARSGGSGEPPKSIRVHVLEMLAAENRDFGLAEIIDRVHDAGIQAHDDAVRSITIKLMKDGRVERVGRGQYRLARRGGRNAEPAAPAADEPTGPAATAPDGPPEGTLDYSPPLNLNEPWDSGAN
jgi:hypothetical protein